MNFIISLEFFDLPASILRFQIHRFEGENKREGRIEEALYDVKSNYIKGSLYRAAFSASRGGNDEATLKQQTENTLGYVEIRAVTMRLAGYSGTRQVAGRTKKLKCILDAFSVGHLQRKASHLSIAV